MNRGDFDINVKNTLVQIEKTLVKKGKEYDRNDNPFHNFDKASSMKGIPSTRVIEAYSLKHEVSIDDMLNDIEAGNHPDINLVNEKFNDAINYLILKKMDVIRKITKPLPY